jgi:hypothetical protein
MTNPAQLKTRGKVAFIQSVDKQKGDSTKVLNQSLHCQGSGRHCEEQSDEAIQRRFS